MDYCILRKALPFMLGGISFPLCTSALKAQPANVILIMADDLGWGDVGFNGNDIIKTPHLDALAKDGVILDRFYSAAPLSSPTRASVLTGRNPFRTGVFSANVGILRPEEITIAELLKEEGYATGHFGKWHLGTLTYKEIDANRGTPENKHLFNPPSGHGFETSFVTESKVPTYDPMKKPLQSDGRFWNLLSDSDLSVHYGTSYWDENGNKITSNLDGDDSRVVMDRVLPFIENSVYNKKPFLSVIWFHAPHLPCVAGPVHASLYAGYTMEEQNYYGCITAMDEQIGRLVAYLKSKNIYDNSILLFCSDNGPELNTPGKASDFKGKKRSLYEGGIRVPSLMVWKKGNLTSGKITTPCFTSDYLPTIVDALAVSSKTSYVLDGESMLPIVRNETDKRVKPLVFCSDKQSVIMNNEYKLYYTKGNYELYNLKNDPFENNNIASLNQQLVEQMRKLLTENLNQYKESFEGLEYGKASYQLVPQIWNDI